MEKVRIYELAKELNTTSKRLIEKLNEINVSVKNHMSLLEEHELEALYKHIGIIRHNKKTDDTEEKIPVPQVPNKPETKKRRDTRSNSPRIIRKTEIIVSSKNEMDSAIHGGRGEHRRSGVGESRDGWRQSVVKSADEYTGLRAGFVRDDRAEMIKNVIKSSRPAQQKLPKDVKKKSKEVVDTQELEKAKPGTDDKKLFDTTIIAQPADTTANSGITKELPGTDADLLAREKEKAVTAGKVSAVTVIETATPVEKTDTDVAVSMKADTGRVLETEKSFEAKTPPPVAKKIEESVKERSKAERTEQTERTERTDKLTEDRRKTEKAESAKEAKTGVPGEKDRDYKTQGARQKGAGYQPAGERTRGEKQRTSTEKPRGERTRPPIDKTQTGAGYQQSRKVLDIPKPELTSSQKEELSFQKGESRRDFSMKDSAKEIKREQKKELVKQQPMGRAAKKVRTTHIGLDGKKGVSEVLSEDFIFANFYNDTGSRTRRPVRQRRDRRAEQTKHIPHRAVLTSVKIQDSITVKTLAEVLKKTSAEVIKKLMGYGMVVTINEEIDFDTAAIVADEFGIKAEREIVINEEDILFDDAEQPDDSKLIPRPPVVVVMGHVDHGKTSLLDAIRSANVIESEAGGITQHIGAYTVKISERNITFLDTPGHEAFTAMRARGAQVTDVAILVVAADDGVMPQTVEAINHAKAAGVSIIVAINKIDKPGADPERVKQELTQHGLVTEEWGGDIICVNVSAKKRENIDQLLEMVLLTADVMELKADPDRQAKGTVIEAKLDKSRGPLATVLVQRGTLKQGDSIVTGTTVGRIRAMIDDKGNPLQSAGPSTPVEILGFPEVPEAGELFYAIEDERIARQLAEKRRVKQREISMKSVSRVSLDDLYKQIQEGKVKDLNIIVKADVQGSVEAVKQSLEKLSGDEVRINIIHDGVGAINESDVTLADVSNAIIIGFNVRPGTNVTEAAADAGVDIRLYRVIYNAIEDIEAAMKGMLDPMFKELVQGHVEIRKVIKISSIGTVAGCYVMDGKISRNSEVRIIRDGIVVHEGVLASLKRFKDDVREVSQGFECGISIERFNDIKENDIIESFIMEEIKR